MRRNKKFDTNKFNIHMKQDYLKLGPRRRINTNIREDLLELLEEISYHSNQPISKLLDVILIELFESEDNVKKIIEKTIKY